MWVVSPEEGVVRANSSMDTVVSWQPPQDTPPGDHQVRYLLHILIRTSTSQRDFLAGYIFWVPCLAHFVLLLAVSVLSPLKQYT